MAKRSSQIPTDKITDADIRAMLPDGYSLQRRKDGLYIEKSDAPGFSAFLVQRDGVLGARVTLPSFVLNHLLSLRGSELRFVNPEKTLALAWVPALDTASIVKNADQSHHKKLPAIVDRVLRHIEDEASSEELRDDLCAMLDWVFEYHDLVTGSAREEAVLTAKAMLAVQSIKRGQGGEKKDANSPLRPVKDAAMKLWPTAKRSGWTARRFTDALLALGHFGAKEGTVSRWMKRLRNGEVI